MCKSYTYSVRIWVRCAKVTRIVYGFGDLGDFIRIFGIVGRFLLEKTLLRFVFCSRCENLSSKFSSIFATKNFATICSALCCWREGNTSLLGPPRSCVHGGSASGVPTFDCSFGLLHPLACDLQGCLFLALLLPCLVMAGLSKRFIQTFLSGGSCRWLFLEVSSFFVHCTKAL